MPPSKPFVIALAFVTATGAAVLLGAPAARAADVRDSLPLTTRLTPAMIDYFALDVAFERPSIASLLACAAKPACGDSDSSRIRIVDSAGKPIPAYDAQQTTVIEQVQHRRMSDTVGVAVSRTAWRRWLKDDRGRIVMSGLDSIVRVDAGAVGREPSTLTRVHHYADVRYVVNDPRLLWPISGLVVLELSNAVGASQRNAPMLSSHAAVSFDGTPYAQILTTNGLRHRVNLQAKVLETTMPER